MAKAAPSRTDRSPKTPARKPALPRRKVTIHYRRPVLYAAQEAALFDPKRYSVIEASTKAGKTSGAIAWLIEQAVLNGGSGRNYWWVAPIYGQAAIAFQRMKDALPKGTFTSIQSPMRITLINGSVIWFKSAENADSLYGEDVFAVVLDEASRMREASFVAVRSTLTATRGPARIIGNVKGRGTWFYRMARRGEAGDPAIGYHKITAFDAAAAGVLDYDEIEDARRNLPEEIFSELYLAVPTEDGGNPFGIADITACVAPLAEDEPPIAWGWDLAKKHDYTVGVGLDRFGRVCRFVRLRRGWTETKARILAETGKVPALLDATGVGDPVVEDIQRTDLGIEPGQPVDVFAPQSNYEGFIFTSSSKQMLMEGLSVAIAQRRITVLDGVMKTELEAFEFESTRTGVRYSTPEGMHDDCVCALALALRKHRQVVTQLAATAIPPINGGDLVLPNVSLWMGA